MTAQLLAFPIGPDVEHGQFPIVVYAGVGTAGRVIARLTDLEDEASWVLLDVIADATSERRVTAVNEETNGLFVSTGRRLDRRGRDPISEQLEEQPEAPSGGVHHVQPVPDDVARRRRTRTTRQRSR